MKGFVSAGLWHILFKSALKRRPDFLVRNDVSEEIIFTSIWEDRQKQTKGEEHHES